MNRYGIAFAVALALSEPAHAAEVAGQRLALTIYNQDLALVEDVRSLDFTAGRSRLEFKDVSASIRPETVALSAAGVEIVEQNFDFDLLTPEKMMEKAVGRQVRIVRTNPGNGNEVTETATVLSVNNGVVLKIGDRIEVLRADGAPTRVIFDKVPENLRARPTLSVNVQSNAAGRRDATLSYLTTGLSWKADYVALFDEQAKKLDMQGWVTLTNKSGTTFSDAVTQLVAGNINIVRARTTGMAATAMAAGISNACGRPASRERTRRTPPARRLLCLSAARAHDGRRQPDQASGLPRCAWRGRAQGLRILRRLVLVAD